MPMLLSCTVRDGLITYPYNYLPIHTIFGGPGLRLRSSFRVQGTWLITGTTKSVVPTTGGRGPVVLRPWSPYTLALIEFKCTSLRKKRLCVWRMEDI